MENYFALLGVANEEKWDGQNVSFQSKKNLQKQIGQFLMKNFENNAFPQKKKKCLQNRLTLFEILKTSTQKLKLKSLVLTIWVIYKNYKSIKKKKK